MPIGDQPGTAGTAGEAQRRREQVERIFEDALDLPREARAAFVDSAAGGEAELVDAVHALLRAHDRAEGILDDRGPLRTLREPPMPERIGAYRVEAELGRGGMGVVYLGTRDDGQFRRSVAIKVIRADTDVVELHRRFRAERQILASLDHPNIARLLDGGLDDQGRPYLVMEHVDGLPVDEYSRRQRLDIDDRLRLFCTIARAVHHAHRNLIVHRDLKPTNILVDGDGVPKLLDFGIAKILDPALVEDHGQTRTGLRPMTPEYASPEQVRGDPITTATDVYALGVVLYQLLTGELPFAEARPVQRELERRILEESPPRPSSVVLRASEGARPARRAQRLHRRLRGDLDRIVLMALRKEPERRYASAEQLMEDVQRHLDGLPVLAHADSRLYRVRKFVGRHALESTAAVITLLSLLGGAGTALWQSAEARRERDRATLARVEAEHARDEAAATSGFLLSLFESGEPGELPGDSLMVSDLLERGVALAARPGSSPIVRATRFEMLGDIYRRFALFDRARQLHVMSLALRREVLGDTAHEVARSLWRLAALDRTLGALASADSLFRQAIAIEVAVHGPEHLDLSAMYMDFGGLLVSMNRLEDTETMFRRALEIRQAQMPPGDSLIVQAMEGVGRTVRRRNQIDSAEMWLRRSIREAELGGSPRELASPMLRLAELLHQHRNQPATAESLYRAALAIQVESYGAGHQAVASTLTGLAALRLAAGDLDEAEALRRQQLDIRLRLYGNDHPLVTDSRMGIAHILHRRGRHGEALAIYAEARSAMERTYGVGHYHATAVNEQVARVLMVMGDYAGAERNARIHLDARRRTFGEDHPLAGLSLGLVGEIRMAARDYRGAEAVLVEALEILTRGYGPGHSDVRRLHAHLATLYDRVGGRADEAHRHRELAAPP